MAELDQKGTKRLDDGVNWFQVWLISLLVMNFFEFLLNSRQLMYTYDSTIPKKLKGKVNKAEFKKCAKYSKEKGQFELLQSYLGMMLYLAIWCLGWAPAIWEWSSPWVKDITDSDLMYDFLQGTIFMMSTGAIDWLLSAPLSLIYKFLIEESHGYNNQTLGGWFKDQILGTLLNLIITPLFMLVLLWIMYSTGDNFVIWACVFITVFAFLIIVITPIFIMPLFNKFDPMEENQLKKDVENLAAEIEYPVSKVEVLDGSKRSGHSNAFQYGFGKIKKIVIYDTLLEQHLKVTEEGKKAAQERMQKEEEEAKKLDEENKKDVANDDNFQKQKIQSKTSAEDTDEDDETENTQNQKLTHIQSDYDYANNKGRLEILSIVAHELGHWKAMDNVKMMASQLIKIYIIFFAFSFALKYTNMYLDFGFAQNSKYLSLILFFMVMDPVFYILQILNTRMTRIIEFAADRFSIDYGYGPYLYEGLITLFVNNSGNLNPDPWYAAIKYDHPALIERLEAIENHIRKVAKDRNPGFDEAEFSKVIDKYNESFKDALKKRHPEVDFKLALSESRIK